MNVWSAVLEMIRDRPILGIGPGNNAFNKIYPLYQRPRYTALSAYSVFLEIAVETGFIGALCFLWLLIVTFNQGVQQLGRLRMLANPDGFWLMGAIAAIAGILSHGLVDTVWYRPEVSTLWWLMVAIVASYYIPANPETSEV
jgi:putative inorganic carbon (HCO3(-)) transporter